MVSGSRSTVIDARDSQGDMAGTAAHPDWRHTPRQRTGGYRYWRPDEHLAPHGALIVAYSVSPSRESETCSQAASVAAHR